MSYKFNISPNRKVFTRFLGDIHGELHEAFSNRAKTEGLTKSALAKKLGINKSLITRKFNGTSNLTIESIADLAWAMEYLPEFKLTPLEDIQNNQTSFDCIYPDDTSFIINSGSHVKQSITTTNMGPRASHLSLSAS